MQNTALISSQVSSIHVHRHNTAQQGNSVRAPKVEGSHRISKQTSQVSFSSALIVCLLRQRIAGTKRICVEFGSFKPVLAAQNDQQPLTFQHVDSRFLLRGSEVQVPAIAILLHSAQCFRTGSVDTGFSTQSFSVVAASCSEPIQTSSRCSTNSIWPGVSGCM